MAKDEIRGSNVIISRTPFRLPLGGGGTDLPSYYKEYGGFFVSAAINMYMYIAIHKRFQSGLRINYSQTEIVEHFEEVKHPIVREALRSAGIPTGLEISSFADAPAYTGLGSSGSFCVGLLRALYAIKNRHKSQEEVAEEACNIAMDRLHEPSGKQDEYVASFGGIKSYEIDKKGNVKPEELKLDEGIVAELESNIIMFYTNITRSSGSVLGKQQKSIASGDPSSIEKMRQIKRIGIESKKALESEDLRRFGELLHEHWLTKRGVTDNMSTDQIDKWYEIARQNGAIGGKIVGAGGGGFLMLYCESGQRKLRAALTREGLKEQRVRFDFEGSKVIYNI